MKKKEQRAPRKTANVRHVNRPLPEQRVKAKNAAEAEIVRRRVHRGRTAFRIDLDGVQDLEEGLRLKFAGQEHILERTQGSWRVSVVQMSQIIRRLLYRPYGNRYLSAEEITLVLRKAGRELPISWRSGHDASLYFAWARDVHTFIQKESWRLAKYEREGTISNQQFRFLWDRLVFRWTDQQIADEVGRSRGAVTGEIQRALNKIEGRRSARAKK
ncbi:MAG: hypothetical protein ABR899_02480 [Candidatus Krumholzibacteriaceae bacterium]|jgi:hypothetical protein